MFINRILLITALLLLTACVDTGAADTAETTPDASVAPVQPTPTPEPTPRPSPTPIPPTPEIIYLVATPTPVPPAEVPAAHTPAPEERIDQQPPETATPALPPTPVPPPTAQYRPAQRPETLGYSGFTFSNSPKVVNDVLTFQAVIDGQGYQPTQVQIYHALDISAMNEKCSTAKPLAFVEKGPGGGITSWQWEFCSYKHAKPLIYVDEVPWLAPRSWSYDLRRRTHTIDPFIYDWSFSVDLDDERVYDLMYDSGEGFIVVIFNGARILAKVWVSD